MTSGLRLHIMAVNNLGDRQMAGSSFEQGQLQPPPNTVMTPTEAPPDALQQERLAPGTQQRRHSAPVSPAERAAPLLPEEEQRQETRLMAIGDEHAFLLIDNEIRIVGLAEKKENQANITIFDHGKLASFNQMFSNEAGLSVDCADGRIKSLDLKGMGKTLKVQFNADGTALIDGKPVNDQSLDFTFTSDAKEHLEFDEQHKLKSIQYSDNDTDDTTIYRNGLPVWEHVIDRKTNLPSHATFDETGQMVRMVQTTPEVTKYLDLYDGIIVDAYEVSGKRF
jgi:hypothetical protein